MNNQIIVYSAVWCPDCKRAKKFFGEQRVPYVNIDIEQDAGAMAFVEKINDGKRIIPTIVFPDGSILVEPSNAGLAAKLGLQTQAQRGRRHHPGGRAGSARFIAGGSARSR